MSAVKRRCSVSLEPTFFEQPHRQGLSALAFVLLMWIRQHVKNHADDRARGDAEGVDWLLDSFGEPLPLSAYVFGVRILDVAGIEEGLRQLVRAGDLVELSGRPGLYGLRRPKRSSGAERQRKYRERKRAAMAAALGQGSLELERHEQASRARLELVTVTGSFASSDASRDGESDVTSDVTCASPLVAGDVSVPIPIVEAPTIHGETSSVEPSVTPVTDATTSERPSSSFSSSVEEVFGTDLTTEEQEVAPLLVAICDRYNATCASKQAEVQQSPQLPKRWLLRELARRCLEKNERRSLGFWEEVIAAIAADDFYWHKKKGGAVDLAWLVGRNQFGRANVELVEKLRSDKPKATIAPPASSSTHAQFCVHGRIGAICPRCVNRAPPPVNIERPVAP